MKDWIRWIIIILIGFAINFVGYILGTNNFFF